MRLEAPNGVLIMEQTGSLRCYPFMDPSFPTYTSWDRDGTCCYFCRSPFFVETGCAVHRRRRRSGIAGKRSPIATAQSLVRFTAQKSDSHPPPALHRNTGSCCWRRPQSSKGDLAILNSRCDLLHFPARSTMIVATAHVSAQMR